MKKLAWFAGLGLVGVLLAVLLVGEAGPSEAAFPGINGQIAFVSGPAAQPQIWVMDPNGSNQTNLTINPNGDLDPAWSADGTQIAFASFRDGNWEIYVMDANGQNQTRFTNDPAIDRHPAWSPDGTQIAFIKAPINDYLLDQAEIYVMAATPFAIPTQLTFDPAADFEPNWSPDGTRIAFTSKRTGNLEVYVLDVANPAVQTNLTNNPFADDSEPNWHPNANPNVDPVAALIASTSTIGGNKNVWVMNALGGSPMQLTSDPASDSHPAWSPDGLQIAFQTDRAPSLFPEIYTMDANGGSQTNRTNNVTGWSINVFPDWGPLPATPPCVPTPASPCPTPTPVSTPPSTASPTPAATLAPPPGPGVPLAVGWNAVPYNGATLPVEQALGNCLASVDAVFLWDAASQSWSWWFSNAPAGLNTLAVISRGAILWVRAGAACNWVQPS